MANIFQKFFSNFTRQYVDMGDGTHAEQVLAHPPLNLGSIRARWEERP